ncbi:MAG: hypothetical protein Q9216_007046 [Gyalolechia sp. 2 TL-2023]
MALQTRNTNFTDFKQLITLCIKDDEISYFGVEQLHRYLEVFCATYDDKIDACRQFLQHVIQRVPKVKLQAFVTNYLCILESISNSHDQDSENLWSFIHQFQHSRPNLSAEVRSWVMMCVLQKRRVCRLILAGNETQQSVALRENPEPTSRTHRQIIRDSVEILDDDHAEANEKRSTSVKRIDAPPALATQESTRSHQNSAKPSFLVKLQIPSLKKITPKKKKADQRLVVSIPLIDTSKSSPPLKRPSKGSTSANKKRKVSDEPRPVPYLRPKPRAIKRW